MTKTEDITNEINEILTTKWVTRDGRKVPDSEDVQLGNDAVKIEAAVLYADLAESTSLVNNYKDWFAADIYKAYLKGCCRAIQINRGEITAFDGDRVMAVFIGDNKNDAAVMTALQINHIVTQVINPEIKNIYKNVSYQIQQAVGIDSSEVFVAKTGIRMNNDLVWVGKSPNYAAKMCCLRNGPYATFISEKIYNSLSNDKKFNGQPRASMWEKDLWKETGMVIYKSSWRWSLD